MEEVDHLCTFLFRLCLHGRLSSADLFLHSPVLLCPVHQKTPTETPVQLNTELTADILLVKV